MILKIFSLKNWRDNYHLLAQTKVVQEQLVYLTFLFKKLADYFAEKWSKSQIGIAITKLLFKKIADFFRRKKYLSMIIEHWLPG
jgi:hypothetical protein